MAHKQKREVMELRFHVFSIWVIAHKDEKYWQPDHWIGLVPFIVLPAENFGL